MIRLSIILTLGATLATATGRSFDSPPPRDIHVQAAETAERQGNSKEQAGASSEGKLPTRPAVDRLNRMRGEFRGRIADRAGGPPRPISPQDIDEALAIVQEFDPEWAQRLRETRKDDPEGFMAAFSQHGQRLRGLVELRKRKPELYEVRLMEMKSDVQARRLAVRIRSLREQGQSAEIARLEAELLRVVSSQVNAGLKARGLELLALEDHIKHLRQQLQQDAQNLPATIERRMQALLSQDIGIEAGAKRDQTP
jgi:hypothetical protein